MNPKIIDPILLFFSRRRAFLLMLALLLLASIFSKPAVTLPVALAQKVDTTYEEEIENGRDLLRRRRFDDALKSFKRANEMKGKTSPECFYLMAQAYMGLEAYKNVIQSCDTVIQLAASDPGLQAQAYNLKGIALQKQSDTKDLKKLQDAEAALRQGAALKNDFAEVHFNLGVVLLQQKRDPEGTAELKTFVEMVPNDKNAAEARKMIENPRRAREPFSPDFSITTVDGEYISLDDLHGKIVLLDFWGTWCPPCVASVPDLRDLNKKYAKESSFVMISVSSDGDEEKWRSFIAKEKMVWPQYLDRDHRVQRAFAIQAFPTYVLLNPEGIIRYRAIGLSVEKEATLEEAIRKEIKLLAKPAS